MLEVSLKSLPNLRLRRLAEVVGLDIGSSAIRAVELCGSDHSPGLVRFGQVGLEPGAVVEGEIRDQAVVAAAIRRLWSEAGFTTRKVAVNVSGQRVIVREAEVAAMSAEDFRSALSFEAQELIPIPTAEAVIDFRILGDAPAGPDGQRRMRILLAAAHRESVSQVLRATEMAGLRVVGVDVMQAALLRRVERIHPGGPFGVISVGADLTTVMVNAGAKGSFTRTLAIGASTVTDGLGLRMGLAPALAEAAKRQAGRGEETLHTASLVRAEAAPIVEQVRESLEYFVNRSGTDELEVLYLTGGGTRTPGMVELLGEATGTAVKVLDAFEGLDVATLEAEVVERARDVALGAVGLAAWGWTPADQRLSLLPPEVLESRRRRQTAIAAAAAGAALLVILGGSWYVKHDDVASVNRQVAAVQAQERALRQSSASMSSVTGYYNAVSARQQALVAAAKNVDWPALIQQISAAMPPTDSLTQLSLTASTSTPTASGVPSTASSGAVGAGTQVTMNVTALGGEQAVAGWLRSLSSVPSLSNVWVASSTSSGGKTTFSCTATVTAKAPKVARSWESTK